MMAVAGPIADPRLATGADGMQVRFVDREIRAAVGAGFGSPFAGGAAGRAVDDSGLMPARLLDDDHLAAAAAEFSADLPPSRVVSQPALIALDEETHETVNAAEGRCDNPRRALRTVYQLAINYWKEWGDWATPFASRRCVLPLGAGQCATAGERGPPLEERHMLSLFQFSMRGLLVGIAVVSLGIAALVNAGPLWQGIMWGVALYALTAAILLVVYRRDQSRAFWLGFTLFGWLYLLLVLTSQIPNLTQTWFRTDALRYEDLLATRLAQSIYDFLPESRRFAASAVTPPASTGDGTAPGGGPMLVTGMDTMMTGGGMPGGSGSMMPGGMMGGDMGPGGPGSMMSSGMMGGGMPSMMGPAMVANPNYVPPENFKQVFHALVLLLVAAIGGKTCQFIYRTRPSTEQ